MKPRVVVFVEGGAVFEVVSNMDVDVQILDSDLEGKSKNDPRMVNLEGITFYRPELTHSVDPNRIDRIFTPASNFILSPTPMSHCPNCRGSVKLLSRKDGTPLIYICFVCRKMWEVGVGPVKEES